MSSAKQEPKVTKISALSSEEAKWIEFNKIEYTDQEGRKANPYDSCWSDL
jgi:ADP-ribose pyrophosphatase